MQHTSRKFGIEIEFVGASRDAAARAITEAGVECVVEHYNHTTRSHWKIVSDSSLSHRSGLTGEIVSPILCGDDGVEQLRKVCDALNSIDGCTVNRTCGLHVHLDCRDMTAAEVATVFERYAEYEAQIDLIMPRSRRGQARWCRSLEDSKGTMQSRNTKASMAHAMGRYYKVNMTNIASRGAIEFRQHSGTTDFRKIYNWLCFLQQFTETSINLAQSESAPAKARYYNEVRNAFENADYSINWMRGRNVWEVRKTSTNAIIGHVTSEEIEYCYIDLSKTHSKRETFANVDCRDLGSLFERVTGERPYNLRPDNAVHNMADDAGWLHGISPAQQVYLEERLEDLN